MKTIKKSIVLPILGVVSFIINLALMNTLPDKVALQTSLGGTLKNFVPKAVFIFIIPLMIIVDYIILKLRKENKSNFYILAVIFFILNIIIIVTNT